jgi:hypothetical protein
MAGMLHSCQTLMATTFGGSRLCFAATYSLKRPANPRSYPRGDAGRRGPLAGIWGSGRGVGEPDRQGERATWGAVQYQFGDVDGFWAAVLHRTAERRDATMSSFTSAESDAPLRKRLGAMRGLVSERQLGSYADLDEARRGLTNALATYLEQSRPK